ncbi:reverse transcriptase domain-containing protein [Tanacetum coccineum]
MDEKAALIKVLKSRKQAIAWKLSDIKGINPEFCTHKNLMEEDYKPAVQHQIWVNPNIHDVIKKEIENFLMLDYFTRSRIVTFKFPSILKIKKRPHSRVLMECSPSVACLLAYAMPRARSKGEKSHFMVKEGIVLGHKISKNGIEVDKSKVDVNAKLPHPTTVKGVRSFLGHAGFYRQFIKDFSKISQPMTYLLEKNTPFIFTKDCIQAFQTLKKKLTEAPIFIARDWDLPFELMCDASDFAIEGANRNVEGVNRGVGGSPDFSTIIAQQLQNLLPAILAQLGNQGNVGNQNGNVVNENVQENIKNVLVNGNRICMLSQKVAVSMSWNDFKLIMIEEFCPSHEIQKLETELWNHAMVRAGHAAYTDRLHELARLVPHLISGALTDEAIRNDSIKKVEKRGNVGQPRKDKNGRDDNKRTRTGNVFASTGCGNQENQARGRTFMLGAEDARQDPNIVTGIEPSELGFRYEIEIASGQLVEIDKLIKGCKLEIEGHVFDIDLIPFWAWEF